MEEIQYVGEHLWIGKVGHFFIVSSFVAALVAMLSYYFAGRNKDTSLGNSWKKMGRYAFLSHGISVFSVIGLIFYIMVNKHYEYAYAFNHVSDDLSMKYILSAFWEGQEGSFLLWMFWHVVLGFILMARSKDWENGVMLFLSLIQLVLASFILGVYFGEGKFGINPFVLLRDTMNIPLFNRADYLTELSGSGLNPLLQNYWMTIHPPTLFLGFASVAVPFCYAGAALVSRRYTEWLKPVLPWALFSGAILGTGILMGGAWAYEALNFGGYWAWDPVENMSLVPWIMLLAGIHTNLVAKATGHSVKATLLFYLSSFVLVFYSTFLTRSGILGETSVHAFTELGLEWHLALSLLGFILLSIIIYFYREREIPVPEKEESLYSKEFWMFIGSLVLLISSLLISFSTSLPVINKLMDFVGGIINMDFSDSHGAITDPVAHYNKYQIWIALMIGLLSGMAQFFRYKEENFAAWKKKFWLHTGIITGVSILLTIGTIQLVNMNAWQYWLLSFGCWYAVVSNVDYLIFMLRGNLKMVGSVLGHLGFGIMIIGSLVSGLDKHHISTNKFAQKGMIEGFTEEDYEKNILLIKNKPMLMSGYEVTYVKDTLDGFNRTFTVNYKKRDLEGNVTQEFSLYPYIIYEKTFQKVASSNPSTKHYLGRDIFTYVASLPRAETDPEYAKEQEDSLKYIARDLVLAERFETDEIIGEMGDIVMNPSHEDYEAQPGDLSVGVQLKITNKKTNVSEDVMPVAVIRGAKIIRFPEYIANMGIKVKLSKEVFEEVFVREDELDYTSYTVGKQASFTHKGTKITFNGFGKDPKHRDYFPQESDRAFNALLDFNKNGKAYTAKPIYFIRDGMPFNIKDELMDLGLHFKIGNVDPKAENITILVAQSAAREERITFLVAEDVPNSEYIVLEAIVFPGINLFWIGSIVMLLGLLISMFKRLRER